MVFGRTFSTVYFLHRPQYSHMCIIHNFVKSLHLWHLCSSITTACQRHFGMPFHSMLAYLQHCKLCDKWHISVTASCFNSPICIMLWHSEMAIPMVPPMGCATLKDIIFTWKCFAYACCATLQILFKANGGLLCFGFFGIGIVCNSSLTFARKLLWWKLVIFYRNGFTDFTEASSVCRRHSWHEQ